MQENVRPKKSNKSVLKKKPVTSTKAVGPRRCAWVPLDNPLYQRYHDEEWGVPVYDDKTIFEFLVLESAQAGLSWITVLRKRENYRKAFAGFDYTQIAKFTEKDVKRLMGDAGIIRNQLKIRATINNAQQFMKVQKEFGTFSKYIWGFVGGKPVQNKRKKGAKIPATTTISDALAKDLKARGFK
ncbi:MAG: DNA-3-methyladenine glycosylase I, partial [Bdellovibrionales bacterium]